MKRVNTFEVVPQTENVKECLLRLLDASASLWNELTYERRQNYFGDGDVGHVRIPRTLQRCRRKRDRPTGHAKEQRSVAVVLRPQGKGEYANPPSYWGNEEDGRELRTYIRNNQYTIRWGKRSRLEIHVGQELKDEYGLGYHERLCLEVRGNPKWDGKQGRLELEYDEVSDTFRAFQPVTVPDSRLDSRKLEEFPEVENGSRFRIHHWLLTKPPSTLARTISSPVPRPLVPSTSTTIENCSDGSARRLTKSPAYSRNCPRD